MGLKTCHLVRPIKNAGNQKQIPIFWCISQAAQPQTCYLAEGRGPKASDWFIIDNRAAAEIRLLQQEQLEELPSTDQTPKRKVEAEIERKVCHC